MAKAKKKQWTQVSKDQLDLTAFKIPPKKKHLLVISRPPGPTLNDVNTFPALTASVQAEASSKPHTTVESLDSEIARNDPSTQVSSPLAGKDTNLIRRSPKSAQESDLDIYARKYVPYWLQAVNESFAMPVVAQPLQHINTSKLIIPPQTVPRVVNTQHGDVPDMCPLRHQFVTRSQLQSCDSPICV